MPDLNNIKSSANYINYFQKVVINTVGFCNAKCPYCVTGAKTSPLGGLIKPDTLAKIFEILLKNNAIDKNTLILLYHWGEPFLHPNLKSLIDITNSYNLNYALSTNAGKIPQKIDFEMVKNLKQVIFSMSGFSQTSYDKIHGLSLKKVISNIANLVNLIRYHNQSVDFLISYHVYRFNTDELKACENFANELNIEFFPILALLADWWQLEKYILGDRDNTKIKNDIFIPEINNKQYELSKVNHCPQHHVITIDENANVNTCCLLPRNHPEYSCGNLFDSNISFKKILENKINKNICKVCLKSGKADYLNAWIKPSFYKISTKQMILLFTQKKYKKFIKALIPEMFMKLIRNFKIKTSVQDRFDGMV